MTAAWAKAYAAVGWRTFPLWPGEKRPIYENWPNDATTDPDLLDRYFRNSENNIGVICGELFDAWDIEAEHLSAFSAYMNEQGVTLPEAPIAQTGRGGRHILTEPVGVPGSRNLYLNGTHIGELKSTGGFIVISPSTTESQYVWLWTTPKMGVPPAPDWMLKLLERPSTGPHKFAARITDVEQGIRQLGALAEGIRRAGEGRRNNYLYWAMRQALEEGIPARYAGGELLQVSREVGLNDHEARNTIRSAYEAEGHA